MSEKISLDSSVYIKYFYSEYKYQFVTISIFLIRFYFRLLCCT